MKHDALQQAAEYTARHHRRRRWQKVVTCLAAVVVFCTTYALILPAITMEKQCNIPEHTHTEACYTQVTSIEKKEPVCKVESLNIHQHTAECCNSDGELTCGYADFVIHRHDSSCYDENGNLWCPLPEIEPHTHSKSCWTTPETEPVHEHTDECYEWEQGETLICGQEEREDHIHSEEAGCYSVESTLTCQTPESDGHQHEEFCYDENGDLICGQNQGDGGHTHGENCYQVTKTLTCEIPEEPGHQHSSDCYEKIRGELVCTEPTELPEPEEMEPAKLELTCEEPEIIPHEHTSDCFDAGDNLICGKLQILEHQHTADCFEIYEELVDTETLTCQIPEGEGAHGLEAGCYDENGALICQIEENAGHRHSALCYGTWELTCGMKEHTHTEACTAGGASTHVHSETCYDESGKLICGQMDNAETPEETLLPLTGDDALLSRLAVETTEILPSPPEKGMFTLTPEEKSSLPADALAVQNQDTIRYTIGGTIDTYSGNRYSEGRVRFEFVLPFPEEQAAFNLDAMSWLDMTDGYAPSLSIQNRTIGEQEVPCQVLTGYLLFSPQEEQSSAIPGEFAVPVEVQVRNMTSGERVFLNISAAMEFSVWEDTCPTHQMEETRIVTTNGIPVVDPAQIADYETLLEELEELVAMEQPDESAAEHAEALMRRVLDAYEAGLLSEEEYQILSERLNTLLYGDLETIAEPAVGTNWMVLRDSGWFTEYSGSIAVSSVSASAVRYAAARSLALQSGNDTNPSDCQVVDAGGSSTSDDGRVTVSKTISGTELENVFDITLQVQTSERISEQYEEPDMAVVIVMDISNTMNSNFGGVSRYAAAMEAAEKFLDEFAENNAMGVSKVGYVAFNTDAHQIFGLQSCTSAEQANVLKNTMRTQTGTIINQNDYASSHSRFTNVEAGLKMASDMLSGVSNKNKYIIFLSDGFPTTYVSSGYSGYDPYTGSGTVGNDGVFHDDVSNKYCSYGTSYSDKAAIRARNMASSIKSSGVTIFSIGVDVGGQTIQKYVTDSENANGFSVVDRTSATYEIGDASSTEAYKNWLQNSIGSGYYYDSTDSAGLSAAYDQIFTEIKHLVGTGSQADWVANDPLPTLTGAADAVEFIGFFDKTPTLVSGDLTGSYTSGGENTAAFQSDSNAIKWDLKNSGYTSTEESGSTTYLYQLRYRVRLKNENVDFVEGNIYPTNDTTTLQYRYFETKNGMIQVSDLKTVEFPIPSVKGYLADLTFKKVDSTGNALEGAEFTLSHDDKNCSACRGDGTIVAISDETATSDENGTVTFQNIPSGHKYLLEETKIPAGYSSNGNSYGMTVAYDELTVTVTAYDGITGTWNGEIVNNVYYELPATGGAGTTLYTAGGTLLIVAAGILLYLQKKRGREGAASS